jgi:hypothetical protein
MNPIGSSIATILPYSETNVQTSVVICVRSGPGPVLRALASLNRLPEYRQLEIVIANCCGPDTEQVIAGQYPTVKVLTLAPQSSIAEARGAAIQKTSGEIIAVLHERYQVKQDWLTLMRQNHRSQTADVIGGCVAPASRMTVPQWAMFLMEYLPVTPPMATGLLTRAAACMIPGGNVSYDRSVFEETDMSGHMWELDFHSALFDLGMRFHRDSKIMTLYDPPGISEYVSERWKISREFASRRAAGLPTFLRLGVAGSRILVPLVLIVRMVWALLQGRTRYVAHFLQALPWIGVFAAVQTWGEITGCISRRTEDPRRTS